MTKDKFISGTNTVKDPGEWKSMKIQQGGLREQAHRKSTGFFPTLTW